jgi:hypothetical protein
MSVLSVAHVLTHANATMWWVTLGIGFVVVLVVIVLLSLLLTFVNDIDGEVKTILDTAGGIARNTHNIPALGQTAELGGVLRDELGRHAAVLGSLRGL